MLQTAALKDLLPRSSRKLTILGDASGILDEVNELVLHKVLCAPALEKVDVGNLNSKIGDEYCKKKGD